MALNVPARLLVLRSSCSRAWRLHSSSGIVPVRAFSSKDLQPMLKHWGKKIKYEMGISKEIKKKTNEIILKKINIGSMHGKWVRGTSFSGS